jgi:hypothetical protein
MQGCGLLQRVFLVREGQNTAFYQNRNSSTGSSVKQRGERPNLIMDHRLLSMPLIERRAVPGQALRTRPMSLFGLVLLNSLRLREGEGTYFTGLLLGRLITCHTSRGAIADLYLLDGAA